MDLKVHYYCWPSMPKVSKQTLKIMKLIAIILFAACLQVSAKGYSQISLSETNTPLQKVFQKIQEQSGYDFVSTYETIQEAGNVTVNVKNASLPNALEACLKGKPLTYVIIGKTVVIKVKEKDYINVGNNAIALEPLPPPPVEIHGRVVDKQGEPLQNVSVLIAGTKKGTTTDKDGRFSLTVPKNKNIELVISSVGYQTKTVKADSETEINVTLELEVTGLNDVVVVGYGTQKKSDLTGAIGIVKVDDLNQGVVSSVGQLLAGKSAGVNVVQNDGKPGAGFSINIRGAGSINASNDPLYVIDGVPISNERNIGGPGIPGLPNPRSSRSPLASLNPEDIQSIEVLKDASATAIYGSRGANGVILITTKEGQSGKLQVNYNGYIGIQNISHKLNLLKADDYKRILNAIIDAGGATSNDSVGEITSHTDWQDEVSNTNAPVQNHQLSFSGGTKSASYYISLNYMNQEGLIINSGFKRYSARVNVKSQISDKFDIGLNLTTSYTKDNFATQGGGINEASGALYAAYNYDPTLPVQNSDGGYATSPLITIDNPVALAKGVNSYSNGNRIFGSVYGVYHLTDHLYAKLNLGGDFDNESRKSFISDVTKLGKDNNGIGSYQGDQRSNYLAEGTLHYSNTFGYNQINALAGVTYQRFITEDAYESASNFPSGALGANSLGLGDQTTYTLNTTKFGHRLGSYLGRINYSLKEKYLLTASVRIDGSSRFGKENRFAVFPSLALGWKLSQENFLKDIEALSSLKLRVSWGQTGNQGIGDYPSISTFQQGQVAIWDNAPVTTTTPSRLANPNLKWETANQINIGLDFGFIKNRITGSLDYFRKITTDMLLNLPIPQSTGFNSKLTNIGAMKNTGFELSANSVNISKKNFTWSSSLNLSTLHNEVTDLGPLSNIIIGGGTFFSGNPAIIKPGFPLNSFYGYQIEGVWQDKDNFSATKDNVKPGDLKFRDQNGDSTVDANDRVILGNSFPDISLSLGNTFKYKNFELYFFIEAVHGISMLNLNKIESYYPVNFRRNKFAEPYLNRWTPENPSNKYPSFVNPFDQASKPINSYTVENASYIKFRTVRLSYTLPKLTKAIRNATIYATVENLYTITGYDGVDPAVNPQGNAGYLVDFNTYPTARTFIIGLQVGL